MDNTNDIFKNFPILGKFFLERALKVDDDDDDDDSDFRCRFYDGLLVPLSALYSIMALMGHRKIF